MCLRNVFYPLVMTKEGKKKVLFDCYVKIDKRDDINDLFNIVNEDRFAKRGLSRFQYLNLMYKRNDVQELIKMVQIPCGSCRECLNDISRQWAFRIMFEASKYDNNYFITFTFNDENVGDNRLDTLFFQKFNKKLKTYLKRKGCKTDFRFYGIGEYGSLNARKHYHCIYFNLDIPDLKYHHIDNTQQLHFESKFLNDVYNNLGFIDIAGVDIGSACYVARYCDKKRRLTKTEREDLLSKGIVPEFSAMSRRPGIGADFLSEALEDFKRGILKHYIKGKSFSLPLYYNKKIKEIMAGTDELKLYEEMAKKNMYSKIANQLELSDIVGSLDNYNESIDKVNTKRSI